VLVASYPSGKRPEIPFPYFAEVWTGLEYQFAAHLIFEGMVTEALTVVETVRRRHDGERRNPWNEPECGHHYARAMSSWALIVALAGFHYSGVERHLTLTPRVKGASLRSWWTTPSGWGTFIHSNAPRSLRVELQAVEGSLALRSLALAGNGRTKAVAKLGGESVAVTVGREGKRKVLTFGQELRVEPEHSLTVSLRA
jgi:hypothetical protein